jgi:2-polyprenyl-6-methoxyphenol hydroxylase-like FAD-dependent oxidoreductase
MFETAWARRRRTSSINGRVAQSRVHSTLRGAEPPEGIRHYRFPVSTSKHFERLPRLPRGVLRVADAFCRFNPIHGQGMSSAGKQALLLQDVLYRAAADPDPIPAVQVGS